MRDCEDYIYRRQITYQVSAVSSFQLRDFRPWWSCQIAFSSTRIVFILKNWIFDFHFHFFFFKKGNEKWWLNFHCQLYWRNNLVTSKTVGVKMAAAACWALGYLSFTDEILYCIWHTHTHMGVFIYSTHIWPLASVETTMDGFLLFFIVGIQKDHKGSEPRQDSFRFYVRDASDNRSPPSQLDIVIEV